MIPKIRKTPSGYRVAFSRGNPYNRTLATLPDAKSYAAATLARLGRVVEYPLTCY